MIADPVELKKGDEFVSQLLMVQQNFQEEVTNSVNPRHGRKKL